MFVLTNAWHALGRHRAYSILTVILALVMSFGAIVSSAVSAKSTAAHGTEYQSQKPTAVIRPGAKLQSQLKGDDAKATTEHYLTFTDYSPIAVKAQNKSVSFTYSFTETVPVRQSDSLKAIPGSADVPADKTGGELLMRSFYDAKAVKTNDFGEFKLIKGKNLKYTDAKFTGALISKELAEKNNLSVGSKFTVANPTDASKKYTYTVQGIYEYVNPESGKTYKLAKQNPNNVIYTAYATAYTNGLDPEKSQKGTWAMPNLDITFMFDSPDVYDSFVKIAKKNMPKGYELSSPSLEAYNKKLEPLDGTASWMRIAQIVLLAVGGVLLVIITIMRTWVTRRDEIGMALVTGVTRPRLAWQFILETLMLTVVPVALGLLIGGFTAQPIGKALCGFATPMSASIVGSMIWDSLGAIVLLAVVAMFGPVVFRNRNLFKPVAAGSEEKA
ncbi:ABC transporter permease [Bifidobacterium sp. 64T4]|uniref:ABC transporter permease n=1 Tax=Bifidobacterium pongonis TaxID=2834432 RepID=UPI001C55EE3F|nr:ABC transporter permease [Bifidobacterium pongonis]MBW3095132.1 ABC transporter permease [Bifidobacterium pongonis]